MMMSSKRIKMMASIFNRVCLLEVCTVISMYCQNISYVKQIGLPLREEEKISAGKMFSRSYRLAMISMNMEHENEVMLQYSEFLSEMSKN